MRSSKPDPLSQPIIVGCSLDFDRDEFVVRHAGFLARHLNAPLHLVHSLEPFKYQHWLATSPELDTTLPELDSLPAGNIFRQALSDLNRLCDHLRKEVPEVHITCNVLSGAPAEAIIKEAETLNSLLVVVGSAGQNLLLSALSTTRSLISFAKVPVLVINDDCTADFTGEHLNVLIADSLAKEELTPLRTAASIVSRSDYGRLIHAHVRKRQPGVVARTVRKAVLAMRQGIGKSMPRLRIEAGSSLLARVRERARMAGAAGIAESEHYIPVITDGDPEEQLHNLADEFEADIVVFGKHKMLHAEDMTLGQVPTSGMLTHKSAVIIVPTQANV